MTELSEPSSIAHSSYVLVVDDERNIRRTLSMVLEGEGYQVIEAESAERALELLHMPEQPVDLAIFDLEIAWDVGPRRSRPIARR